MSEDDLPGPMHQSQASEAEERGSSKHAATAWYVVYAKPRMEAVAYDNLHRQGYHAYLPKAEHTRRRRGRYDTIIEPMFPRYLFVRLNSEHDNWAPIRSTLGVIGLVRFGGAPARIPDALVHSLQAGEDERGVHVVAAQKLAAGDRVHIIDGMLAGYDAVVHSRVGGERVAVLLDIAGRYTHITLSAHDLKLA